VSRFLSPSSSTAFVVVNFHDDTHSDWGEMNASVVLRYISMMTKDTKYFMYLLAIFASSFEK
jgi:hypothetical protein